MLDNVPMTPGQAKRLYNVAITLLSLTRIEVRSVRDLSSSTKVMQHQLDELHVIVKELKETLNAEELES
jgi:hypothetical protein